VKQKELKFKISIGEARIQDIENGIVNFGMSAQRRIVQNAHEENLKDTRSSDMDGSNFQVHEHGQ
jgi:hypothetical protein